ncbi:MAG TPA: arsenite methyltransferase [Actinomycetota bacterium]
MSQLREQVRDHYAAEARGFLNDGGGCGCCGDAKCGDDASPGGSFYDLEFRADVPDAAVLASLGCGNPVAVADLREGEAVLDLGSGGGIDVLLSAKRVGPSGLAYGLDMTDDMLELARRNAAEAGVDNVEFLKGFLEDIPLPDESVDVVISNCVINLSIDKPQVFAEMRRVLRPGGRVGVADVVASDELTPAERAERGSYVGCVAGALSFAEYRAALERTGFVDVSVEPTHESSENGIWSAIVRARTPGVADG